jgi:hypothetical protein
MKNDLTHEELQALVGRALVEPSFCTALLNGQRELCLSEFALSAEERAAAQIIQATDLSDFARQLDAWIRARRLRPAVTRLAMPAVTRMAVAA